MKGRPHVGLGRYLPERDAFAPAGPEGDTRIIMLTHAPPVHIFDSEWPIVAEALRVEEGYPGSVNERSVWIKVRRHHADGRLIAYGGRRIQGAKLPGGELVPSGGDLVGALLRLANLLDAPVALAQGLADELLTRRDNE